MNDQQLPKELPTRGRPTVPLPARPTPEPEEPATQPATAPFQLLPGGSASRPPSFSDAGLEVALLHLRTHREAIEAACKPITEAADDLAGDWDIREEEFWQKIFMALHSLRDALRRCLARLERLPDGGRFPLGILATRHQMMIPLDCAQSQIDTVGIALTAYLPICSSRKRGDLQQRHEVLMALRELAKRTQEALDAIGPQVQERCRREHRRAQEELTRWEQREQQAQAQPQAPQEEEDQP